MWKAIAIAALAPFIIGLSNGYFAPLSDMVRRLSMPVSVATVVWFAAIGTAATIPADTSNLDASELTQRFLGAVLICALSHLAGLIVGRANAPRLS